MLPGLIWFQLGKGGRILAHPSFDTCWPGRRSICFRLGNFQLDTILTKDTLNFTEVQKKDAMHKNMTIISNSLTLPILF
jgi:hypothetical protein